MSHFSTDDVLLLCFNTEETQFNFRDFKVMLKKTQYVE